MTALWLAFAQLGALIAAAFRAYTRPSGMAASPRPNQPPWADFGMVNSGGIRAGLPAAGESITWGHVDAVWPWPSQEPAGFTITGGGLRKMIEVANVKRMNAGAQGMVYHFDDNLRYKLKQSDGPREFALEEVTVAGLPLDDNKLYKGCSSTYVLEDDLLGTLGLGELLQPVAVESADVKDYLLQYIKKHSPVGRTTDTL
eukprot:SAG31_NODE_810_length_11919_cov_4.480924_14_plen_200_part_00